MSNIEDDIKRCKEIISKCDDCKFATCEQCEINWTDIQAIKIVLGNLEALCDMQKSADRELENAKKINEEHKKENKKLREKVKELEEELYSANKIINEYLDGIPKQVIKDKIDEINREEQELQKSISEEEREEYADANISYLLCDFEIRKEVLRELMEDK